MKTVLPKSAIWALIFVAQLPMLAVYLLQLLRDPIYGWWPCVVPVLAIGFVWIRWDYRIELPQRPLAVFGLAAGLCAAILAALWHSGWLAAFGLVCTSGSFLVSHHQRDGASLLPIWYLWWSTLKIPRGGNSQLTQQFALSLEQSVKSILRFERVPYVNYTSAIEVPGTRYYFDMAIFSMWSWPLFIAVAMFYSTLLRRSCIEALLNIVLALFWCFAFHCCLFLTCVIVPLAPDSWHVLLAAGVWGVIAFGLFLSSERGMRVLLHPIAESSSEARFVNPFVQAWNWCFSKRNRQEPKWLIGEQWFQRPTLWLVVCIVGLTLLLQSIRAPRALAALSAVRTVQIDSQQLAEFVFSNGEEFEYRHTRHSPPLVLDREVDIWTTYAPLSTTEHILASHQQRVFDVSPLMTTLGWQIDPIEQIPVNLPSGKQLTYGSVAMNNGRQKAHVLYAWLSSDGIPLEPTNESASGFLLISKAELVSANRQMTLKILRAEFSRFVVGVQSQLAGKTNSE